MDLLVVDDDDDIRTMLSDLLELEGFSVYGAENGKIALEKLERRSYDLVLLDITMPVMDGITALKEIRKSYDVPVLMLTARGDETDRVNGLENGADDYLPKPFNDRELIARVKAILRRVNLSVKQNNAVKEDLLHFEGLVVNRQMKQVFYNSMSLNLTIAEFNCLSLLIDNLNNVLDRDFLSKNALGRELALFDRSIDMHMSNMRKKLPKRADDKPWFIAVRSRGYMMNFEPIEMGNQ